MRILNVGGFAALLRGREIISWTIMGALAGCDARRRSRRMAASCKRPATPQRARQCGQNVQVILSRLLSRAVLAVGLCCASFATRADDSIAPSADDPHLTEVGFFDMHICNWPGRPLFYMSLFSTTRYSDIKEIEVFYPDGRPLSRMNLAKYRIVARHGMPEKRVFMIENNVPQGAPDGWYSTRVTLHDGKKYAARDYVMIKSLPIADQLNPPADANNLPLPSELSWGAVPGAKFYQVFIRDLWDGEKIIYTSAILDQPKLKLSEDILQPGGLYSWRIHARDVNEDKKFGDFNHGSLGAEQKFSVAN